MKVWIVAKYQQEYETTRIEAVYTSESIANEHAAISGGYVEEASVLTELDPSISGQLRGR